MPPSRADRWSLLLREVASHDHRQLSQYAPTCLQRLQSSVDRLNGPSMVWLTCGTTSPRAAHSIA
jgi:hypothetical protein